jgi:hypothetical protein
MVVKAPMERDVPQLDHFTGTGSHRRQGLKNWLQNTCIHGGDLSGPAGVVQLAGPHPWLFDATY